MFTLLEKNLWLSLALLAGLIFLLVASALHLGGGMPALRELRSLASPGGPSVSSEYIDQWLTSKALTDSVLKSNAPNPFFTLYFQPAPPPPTKTVEVSYQGYIQTSQGNLLAYIRVADRLLVYTNGARVAGDLFIKNIEDLKLVLTNSVGATNVLEFNAKKGVVIPAT